MAKQLSSRKRHLLRALYDLGGSSTLIELARHTKIDADDIAQSLGACADTYVLCVGARADLRVYYLQPAGQALFFGDAAVVCAK